MKHRITEKFNVEVGKQIYQFGIDLIEDISNEIDSELQLQQPGLGLSRLQMDAFGVLLQNARRTVLEKYSLETKDSRTDVPYLGETYSFQPPKP